MKLSYLIDFVRQLEATSVRDIRNANERRLQELTIRICNHPIVKFDDHCHAFQVSKIELNQAFDTVDRAVESLLTQARDLIQQSHAEYLRACREWFHEEQQYLSVQTMLERRLEMRPEVREKLRARVSLNQDWRWPAMILRPSNETLIDDMVAFEPLYIVDTREEYLKPTLDRFPLAYQRRLRPYAIDEKLDGAMMAQLPQGQFAFCLAFNFFNYRPLEYVCQYLTELWGLLRPGGTLIFTYNDCDHAHGCGLAENKFMSYTPGSLIEQHLTQLGFEIVEKHRSAADVAWYEVMRPGELTSLRGGSTLAKIVAKSR